MKLIIPKMLLVVTIGIMMGCSTSNESDSDSVVDGGGDGGGDGGSTDNGQGGGTGTDTGDGNSSLSGIAGADASSQPVSFDVSALQASLDGIQGTEPVPVEAGDTVVTLLQKAR